LNEIKTFLPSAIQILPQVPSRPGGKIPPLSRGEILEGMILGQEGPQHFLLRIKGQDLKVETQTPLPASGKIALEVETVTPQVILKLLSANETGNLTAQSLLKKYLGEGVPLEKLAEKLSALGKMEVGSLPPAIQKTIAELKTLLAQYGPPFLTDPQTLQEKIIQSGLFWENRLQQLIQKKGEEAFLQVSRRDLKGLLLKLKSELHEATLTEGLDNKVLARAEEWIRGVDAYLQKMEAYQFINQRYADSSEKWMLLLPLWIAQNLQFLEMGLGFSRGEETSPEKDKTSLLFLLQLPEIGRIRIEVIICKDALFGRFGLADPSFQEWIQQNLPDLEKRLTVLGFHPSFSVAQEPLEERKEAIVGRMEENAENLVRLIV
jgi:hypothetical protein